MMSFLKLAISRRSARSFKLRNIPEQDIYYLLDAARWAPSANNLQNWRFIVVREMAHKKRLVSAAYDQVWLKQAPLLIVVCSLTKKIERQFPKTGKKLAMQSTSAAIQNVLLAAEDKRLAACWVAISSEKKIRTIFEIPEDVEVHGIIAIGYPLKREIAPPRINLSDLVFFEEWDSQEVDYAKDLIGPTSQPLLENKHVKNLREKADNFKAKANDVRKKLQIKKK